MILKAIALSLTGLFVITQEQNWKEGLEHKKRIHLIIISPYSLNLEF
jgi:hypothetical protein